MNTIRRITGLLVLTLLCLTAHAAVPGSLSYQGYLTDADGSAVNGSLVVTFSIYTTDLGGVPLWSDPELVFVDQGLFSV
ncbi:MAG: hypothetical protein HKM98_09325, partial [Gammaproteobacteria bacterium]|nr:hypothetical protein [Gammaproteobacteria bacterium]